MELHFLRPYWLIAIIPVLYLCWRLASQRVTDNWRNICDQHLLERLLIQPKSQFKLPIILLILGFLLTILAMAGISWKKEAQPIYRPLQGSVIALNLSPSMNEQMGTTTKIDRARYKMLDFLNRKKEGLIGLVVYTDEAHIISPLTEDSYTIANFVPSLDPTIMPTFNDDTVVGLKMAKNLLKQAGVNGGDIILITDQITNAHETLAFARSLFKEGFRLNIFEIAENSGRNAEFKKLAQAGGGIVIPLSANNADIKAMLAQTSIRPQEAAVKKTDQEGVFWHDDGRWLVFFILPLALLAFRRGYL